MIELLTFLWLFNTSQPPQSTLTSIVPQAEFIINENAGKNFTVKFITDLKKFDSDRTILKINNVLTVNLRQHAVSDRKRQNYPAFKMDDGSVPVLEATIDLHSSDHPDWNSMTIGIPLAILKKPFSEHEIVLNFSGVRWTMYVDGQLLDNDFPYGFPKWSARNTWNIDTKFITKAEIFTPAITPEKRTKKPTLTSSVQYWTPPGHNSWVGDVATFFYKGRYHIFYLYDRRHHQSKFGKGAHYFEHISTTDFKIWTEHEAATPLEEQFECIGTGTPFVLNNQLCIAYGLHSERIFPDNQTTRPAQIEFIRSHGYSGKFDKSSPGAPAGATYAISQDATNFHKTWVFFHPSRNPSVYRDPDGKLKMLANHGAKGMWETGGDGGWLIDEGWRCISPDFPPGGDCTFFFLWGRYDYIIGGFRNLWYKKAPEPISEYKDLMKEGLDFYDGSNVPSISEIPGDRFLSAAWIPITGWGGNLIIRELIQFPDGRLGSKWFQEIMPAMEKSKALKTVENNMKIPTAGDNFMLNFNVDATVLNKGKLAITFMSDKGEENSCEFQISLDTQRAQYSNGSSKEFAETEKSLREGGSPQNVRNYAIEKLIGTEKTFAVRIIVKGDNKIGGSLIDAEIAGSRTMITYRPDLYVHNMIFRTDGLELEDVKISKIKE